MAEKSTTEMKATLGLTGLTMNAMALIAPGAFLWLTFSIQATTGVTAPAMWLGIFVALLLCLATAVAYAELSKLYPGPGSSYFFAEQSWLNHPPGSVAWQFDSVSGEAYAYQFATTQATANGQTTETITRDANMVPQPKLDAAGKPVPYQISYPMADEKGNFLSHGSAGSVLAAHNWGFVFVQATVAILILVGFESCTALGGEAKNAKHDIPIAVITSLLVQGAFCYLFEYFAANYFLNSGYTMMTAQGSSAPLGDMMIAVGDALFAAGRGRIFMLIEAITVFLALIGTTLSCINTGARVTYAMGKDQEVPEHFGMLHAKNLSPHRAIWVLGIISMIFGCVALLMPFGDAGAIADSAIQSLPHGLWSSVWFASSHDHRSEEHTS